MSNTKPLAELQEHDFNPTSGSPSIPVDLERELEKLRQREALLDATEQIARIGHYEWNYDLDRLESCSDEYAHLFEMTVDEVLKSQSSWDKTLEQIHPEDLKNYRVACEEMRDAKTLDTRYRIQTKSGSIKHIREIGIVATDMDGVERGTFGILQDISQQVKHERDLEYRDELARQAESVTDIGHFIYDEENEKYLYMSEGCARIYGSTPEDYLSRINSLEDDLSDIVEEDRERVNEAYRLYLQSGQDCNIEYRIRRTDGEVRWLRELGKAKEIREGRVVQTLGVVQDITEQLNRSQELILKNTMATQAEALTDIGYFLFDEKNNRHLFVSEGQARIVGMSVEEYRRKVVTNQDYIQLVFEEDQSLVEKAYFEDIDEHDRWRIEYRVRLPNGELRWVREVGQIQKDGANGARNSIGVIQDITQQKTIEQELIFKDALANQAEAITEIGHFVYDEINQVYTFVSPGLLRIHGRSESEFIGGDVSWERDLKSIHPDDQDQVRRAYSNFMAHGENWQVDYRLTRSDGVIRWVREMGKVHSMNHGIPETTIGVLQDITAQKEAEQEIIKTRDSLEQQVVVRTMELANTVKQLQKEVEEREKISAELEFLANHDALTGLPSLRLCKDRLDRSLAEARRNRQMSAVMFLDLDGFKEINDSLGHEFGDRVLKVTAERIVDSIRETDTVARIGGDEFVIILSSLPEIAIVSRVAENLIQQLGQIIQLDEHQAQVSGSVGISLYPENGTTAEELIREADKAMYQVKATGKNNFGFSSRGIL
ncbi:MAG: PAS domain-containing protein [Pseudomonadota bacterium]